MVRAQSHLPLRPPFLQMTSSRLGFLCCIIAMSCTRAITRGVQRAAFLRLPTARPSTPRLLVARLGGLGEAQRSGLLRGQHLRVSSLGLLGFALFSSGGARYGRLSVR
jgi:hypothetical protein